MSIYNDITEEALAKAINNENNESIIKLNSEKISTIKNNILQQLQLPRLELKSLNKKLKQYRYIDEIPDIQYGSYIRWISLKNPDNIKLTSGGIIIDIELFDDGVHIRCKNNLGRIMQIKMNECLIFQKLTDQERLIIHILDHLK